MTYNEKDPQTYSIIGAAMAVHSRLGPAFLEAVYQEAMEIELGLCEIPFIREVSIDIQYRNQILNTQYRADFICFENVIVELKAVSKLVDIHQSQVINYLNATGYKKSLLINFGSKSLEYKRILN